MEEFKIYSITNEYIEFLQEKYPNVYSNKLEHRTHTRKCIGTVMMIKNSKGEKELKGSLRISHMIPVPITELIEYNIDAEEDVKYKELIKDEWIYIRSNKQKILNYAKVMYKQKNEKQEIGYVKSALDYKKLELLCKEFEMKKNVENDKSTFERIYDVVKQIPYGKVATYGQVAALAGNKRWSRVVGYALHVNPDPENIPCYRVVNRLGEVSKAFAFGGENRQIELLEAEGIEFVDGRVNMYKYQWNQVTIDMMK